MIKQIVSEIIKYIVISRGFEIVKMITTQVDI